MFAWHFVFPSTYKHTIDFLSSITSLGTGPAYICSPNGIAFDPAGNLWVADSGNSRVREFAALFSTGMNASRLIGQESYFYGGPNTMRSIRGFPVRRLQHLQMSCFHHQYEFGRKKGHAILT
jgi:secreted PhoX family phosphatase